MRYREFRQADGVRDIPIVLTTTNTKALHDIVGATEALEIVGKPYDLDELATIVRRSFEAPFFARLTPTPLMSDCLIL